MSSRTVLHAGPAVGFDQPFEMLAACHERVRRTLDLLQRLQAHVQSHGADAQAQSAATDVLRYFDIAGPAHHEDEERHVLPRLREAGEATLADRLAADHREMTRLWTSIRAPLQSWAAGQPALLDTDLLAAYSRSYEDHLSVEDARAFAIARAATEPSALKPMGEEMAARRQR
ncbi:hemerythrin domain-containing protein [Roseateles cellulosilyticus]|uniref:Hemerythrin domain-containing protein n=1 Tax=Pelomonas cellulosilytica TaxID=2906762 RepID=A0ABS8XYT2_9BURK|nr:hemerythrin domain-containing protein [Pelomonas sp. P8]MCE4555899.1 hemerythrin domain-containing protein [Pelomonas sp. P8]